MTAFEYPEVRRDGAVVETLHGREIADPYRYLEDPDAGETKKFVDKQNKISRAFIDASPVKEKFNSRLTEVWNYPKFGTPYKRGDRYYYSYNEGLQNQNVVYVKESLEAPEKVFLDPNTWHAEGLISLSGMSFTEDGTLLAFSKSEKGSDAQSIHFMDTKTGKQYDDVLTKIKYSGLTWTHDNKGIFYCRYDIEKAPDGTETTAVKNQKLYYHRLGTSQDSDVLCAEFPAEPDWMMGSEVSEDGKYVLLSVFEGCEPANRVFYCDLSTTPIEKLKESWTPLIDNFEAQYGFLTNDGTKFWFQTNKKAPRERVIVIDIENPDESKWEEVVPEHPTDPLQSAYPVGGSSLLLSYLRDVKGVLALHDLHTGKLKKPLDIEVGSVSGISGRRTQDEVFFKITNFLSPGRIFRMEVGEKDIEAGKAVPSLFKEVKVAGFDPTQFVTEQVFFESKSIDGSVAKVPMFVVHKKGLKKDGSSPCLLYGYGGFQISIEPTFSPTWLVWMQNLNGVLAVANIRGGLEYGKDWWMGGSKGNKQNCFNDFCAAGEELQRQGFTSKNGLAINGGSNGGLLVGACMTQRPELFSCVVANVGVLDMLRFHKFTIGHAWCSDFGNPDRKDEFDWLIKYSPLHNIRSPEEMKVQYPSTLLVTADHDDRVVPLHSLKFIAELQHKAGGSKLQEKPLMISVDVDAGHGAGKPTSKIISEKADMFAFIAKSTGAQWTE
uniref:Prolyl endopeptidase n=1 Tax=Chromera velia CCMP2878 TaxID=1169474 RepID=A0A0G4HJG0_9ALVE|eukprot:Cvel_28130.t1-p1 / transcript=Cvel_28130.t1 / gene=Cvel_28130 / organism=Chromera_velia_CCMP2878 / gene_product=Prolyl endopeptidase, putative / transcript_product=Prolyl endopeptidase, putative / location=Cvel_scaffold3629:3381-13173(-) / protein_length=717 / sequence_SO=supercontig / SO=protein_coding / is_pseudo=false